MRQLLIYRAQVLFGNIIVWLSHLFKGQQEPPRLTAIYLAASAGKPMRPANSVLAIAGKGLQGDRYAEDLGFWKSVDACQVTLITKTEIERAGKRASVAVLQLLGSGGHRRNLVISGVDFKQLNGSIFRIGDAVFRFQKPRTPCAYPDRVSESGLSEALGKHSGACIEVITSGLISVGDNVAINKD